jgi:uncharacterized protein (TIGR02271 family)
MSLTSAPEQLIGRTLMGSDGDKIGKIADVYLDDQTGKPEWLAVTTGMFGSRVSFVPLAQASSTGDDVTVPYSKEQVKDAPNAEADGQLSQQEEAALYSHYGLEYGEDRSDSGLPEGTTGRTDAGVGGPGQDTSGPNTDSAMTRSEEELEVGKVQREAGRVRLRKHVVTENVETTVPVSHEEVVVEREPITDGNIDQALDGPAISEEEHEIVLNEEEVVVNKQAVPKERVRLDKQTVVEEERVGAELRKEQIEVEDGRTR